MKIVVGTEDGKNISKSHFGMSKIFVVYEIENGDIVSKKEIENPIVASHKHAEAKGILSFLGDNNVFIGRAMGRESVPSLLKKGIIPLLTKLDIADDTVRDYINNGESNFIVFDKEKASSSVEIEGKELFIGVKKA